MIVKKWICVCFNTLLHTQTRSPDRTAPWALVQTNMVSHFPVSCEVKAAKRLWNEDQDTTSLQNYHLSHLHTFGFGIGEISLRYSHTRTHTRLRAIWWQSEVSGYSELHQTGKPNPRASWTANKHWLHIVGLCQTINSFIQWVISAQELNGLNRRHLRSSGDV